MKTNIIKEVIDKFNLNITEFENYTSEIAKIKAIQPSDKLAKLIIVTSMNPTPVGEGKTTTSIGLVDGLNAMGVKAIGALREPSMGPVFGMKGTGSGSNMAKLLPFDKINLHFTGDLHAISSANNLISAIIENEIYQNSDLNVDKNTIIWKRCEDMNDRSLRQIDVQLFTKDHETLQTAFNITAASDLMALFCLAESKEDFRNRISQTVVAYSKDNQPITIEDLQITEAIMTIISDALDPNLVRTVEGSPVFVHGGPFANIAHGCSSIIASNMARQLGEVVVTEAGFGSDLGLEKFMDITCSQAKWSPDLIVLTISLKSILYNAKPELTGNEAVKDGFKNVLHHINHCKKYKVNLVVAINHRSEDNPSELEYLKQLLSEQNVAYALSDCWALGAKGALDLAQTVMNEIYKPTDFTPLYQPTDDLFTKINNICINAYGSNGAKFSDVALQKLQAYQKELPDYYVCIAKNPYSLTCNQKILGAPTDFWTTIEDVEINHAAKLIIPITSVVYRMPGLPKVPAAKNFVMK